MKDAQGRVRTGTFVNLQDQIGALHEGPGGAAMAGHQDIGADLWLSSDPAGRAVMTYAPCEGGFRLALESGDSGVWTCLGMRLSPEVLRGGRYMGLLVALHSENLITFTPTLRYFFAEGGLQDAGAAAPVVMAGGARECLAYIPLDPALLERAAACELNLFFHTDTFVAEFSKIEPLLIL